jgi:hypothetical protein
MGCRSSVRAGTGRVFTRIGGGAYGGMSRLFCFVEFDAVLRKSLVVPQFHVLGNERKDDQERSTTRFYDIETRKMRGGALDTG